MNYKELEQQFLNRKITRRQFLAGAAALGAVSLTPGVLGGNAMASTPKHGGRVRIAFGHGSSTDSLDPATFQNDYTINLCYGHHNHLVEVTREAELIPELAEEWHTDDAQKWVLKIRRGVEFHNGKEVKADDVIASLQHHMGEDAVSAARSLLDPVVEMRKDDDYTVVIQLESANADFMYILSDYHLAIKPAVNNGAIDPEDGIGAGPYRIESFEPGQVTHLKRFENYWKEGLPYFDEVETRVVHDQSSRTNALMTDELDIIDRVDLGTADRLGAMDGLEVDSVQGFQHYTFAMRTDTDPLTDRHIRLALKYAVDREQLVNTILRGFGEVGNDHPISRNNRFFAEDLEQREYDPDRARYHLEQAGVDNLQVELSVANAAFPGAVSAGELYRETASLAGIDLVVNRVPDDGYWSDVWMNDPFCAVYWGGRASEDWMFSTTYISGADWNDTFWENDRFDQLIREARAIVDDDDKRHEMYAEAQRLVRDDGGVVLPMWADFVFGRRSRIRHEGEDQLSGIWNMDGHKWWERWWMDE